MDRQGLQKTTALAEQLFNRIKFSVIDKVESYLHGDFKSIFHGRGMDFMELREYTANDDIRDIDWNVTARTNKPHIRVYSEEKELVIWIVIDISASMDFGSDVTTKREITSQFASVLSYLAVKNSNKLGAVFISDKLEFIIPPSKGIKHAYYIIQSLIEFKPKKTSNNSDIHKLKNILGRKNYIFFISDFIFPDFSWQNIIGELIMRNTFTAVKVADPVEENIPQIGYISLADPETGRQSIIDTSNVKIIQKYEKLIESENKIINDFFHSHKADILNLYTDSDIADVLIEFSRTKNLGSRPLQVKVI